MKPNDWVEVGEGALCLCSYPQKTPETVLMVIKSHFY